MKNRVQLIGNLGSNPSVITTSTGKEVANVSLAVNERWQDKNGQWKDNTEWYKLKAWGNVAKRMNEQLKKGALLAIEGKLVNTTYENKEGQKVNQVEVLVNNFFPLNTAKA